MSRITFPNNFVNAYREDVNDTCLIKKDKNEFITSTYEGIPQTLLLNVIGWTILILLFTLLRRKAWDYGRLALVQGTERWTRLFYGVTEEVNPQIEANIETSSVDSLLRLEQGIFTWIFSVFKISEDRVSSKCGPDALHYLSFQRHLLLLTGIFTFIALTIILPINFQGSLQGDRTTFGHTTISNLESGNPLLWVHIILAFLYIPITLYMMSRCTGRVPSAEIFTKSLLIRNIAHAHRNQSDIFHYLRLLFKEITFKNVELAYDVAKLTELVDELHRVSNAKLQAEAHLKRFNERLRVSMNGCGYCCSWNTDDAIEFYTSEENRLLTEVDQERSRALARPLGIAFVTVGTAESADYIVKKFKPGTSRNWLIFHAPAPSDIFWENLGIKSRFWYLRVICINTFLFIFLFFLTTPIIIVNNIDSFNFVQKGSSIFQKVSPYVSEFLPTLMLCTMAALLPVLVSYSDQHLSYWTRSKQNNNIMQKTFIFLLFMVLILPSLGLTSAKAFVEWSLEPNNQTLRWECVFLPDNGAFFVNYVITSALIGTSLELIRFPELFMYIWFMIRTKSPAEIASIRKSILREFPFGVHYAWTLVVFTTVTTYSLICPLITPFGLLYFLLKHFVDRYNLYFAYGPTNMIGVGGDHIHSTAVYLVRISLVLLIATVTGFTTLRGGMDKMAIVSIVGLLAATMGLFCFIQPCVSRKKHLQLSDEYAGDEFDPDYIAPVLQPNHFFEGHEAIPIPVIQNDYGTQDDSRNLVHNIAL